MPGTVDRVLTSVATQLIQATARTADGVGKRCEFDAGWFLRPAKNGN